MTYFPLSQDILPGIQLFLSYTLFDPTCSCVVCHIYVIAIFSLVLVFRHMTKKLSSWA